MAVKNLATKPITKLTGMKVSEISLVDDAASPGADVILMKRKVDNLVEEAVKLLKGNSKVDGPVGEAIDLLKAYNPSELRDQAGRWVNEAVNLLRGGPSGGDLAAQAVARGLMNPLSAGVPAPTSAFISGAKAAAEDRRLRLFQSRFAAANPSMFDRVGSAARVAAGMRLGGVPVPYVAAGVVGAAALGGLWAASPKVQEAVAPAVEEVKSALKTLYAHAKNATNAVASHVNRGLITGVNAVKDTKVEAINPVEGGGVQFSFTHGLGSSGNLKTHVQIRPEHLAGKPGEHALNTLHRYLASRKEDFAMETPFSSDKDAASWFRYSHSPLQTQQQPGVAAGPGGQRQELLPYPSTTVNNHGIEVYGGQNTQEPDFSRRAKEYGGSSEGTAETSRGQPFIARSNNRWIPGGRPDVQKHIVRVYDQIRSQPQGAAKLEAMTRKDPTVAGGHGFFTPRGDYVPKGREGYQWNVMRMYEQHHQDQGANGLPFHVTTSEGAGAGVGEQFQEPRNRNLIAISLSPQEAEVLGDHISGVEERNSGSISPHLRSLMAMSENIAARNNNAATKNATLPLTQEEVNTAWRSLDAQREQGLEKNPEHGALRRRLEAQGVNKRLQKIVKVKLNR